MVQRLVMVLIIAGAAAGGLASPPDEIQQALAEGALVLDVRTPAEFAQRHYPGALNIPYDQLRERHRELGDPARTIVIYCRTGRRSAIAAETLRSLGFTRIIDAKTLENLTPRGR